MLILDLQRGRVLENDCSYSRAEAVNPILSKVILETAQAYPSQGKSNVGGWRSRNDLFHWNVPEVKDIRPDRYRGTLSAVGWASVCRTGNYNAPHAPPVWAE